MTQVVGYVVSSPPSTGSNAPVMIDDASLVRKWRGDQLPMLALAAGGPAMRGPL